LYLKQKTKQTKKLGLTSRNDSLNTEKGTSSQTTRGKDTLLSSSTHTDRTKSVCPRKVELQDIVLVSQTRTEKTTTTTYQNNSNLKIYPFYHHQQKQCVVRLVLQQLR
jgi:hypothetical protein